MILAERLRKKMKGRHLDEHDLRAVAGRYVERGAVDGVVSRVSALIDGAARHREAHRSSREEKLHVRAGAFCDDRRMRAGALAELDDMGLWDYSRSSGGSADADVSHALAAALREANPSSALGTAQSFAERCRESGATNDEAAAAALVFGLRVETRNDDSRTAFSLACDAMSTFDIRAKRSLAEESLMDMISDALHESARDGKDARRAARAELASAEAGDIRAAARLAAQLRSGLMNSENEMKSRTFAVLSRLDKARAASIEAASSLLLKLWKTNTVRTDIAGAEPRDVQTLGEAAAASLYGVAHRSPNHDRSRIALVDEDGTDGWAKISDVTMVVDGVLPITLDRVWLDRFAPLSLRAVLERLKTLSASPGIDEVLKNKFFHLHEAVSSGVVERTADHESFASWLGMEDHRTMTGNLDDGLRVHSAIPGGHMPSRVVCDGKGGRKVECRAVADEEGRLVGYRAFDPLSGEFRGEGLHAIYGLDGSRAGMLARDERGWLVRLGEPRGGFVTVPERIEVK